MIIFPEEENTQPSWQVPASEPCCAQHGARHLLRTAVSVRLSSSKHSGASAPQAVAVGAARHLTQTSAHPKDLTERMLEGTASQAMATKTLLCTAT